MNSQTSWRAHEERHHRNAKDLTEERDANDCTILLQNIHIPEVQPMKDIPNFAT